MNEQELNKKLAEWAGFKEKGTGYVWPDGRFDKAPNFPNDLNGCFKWLMNLVREKLSEREYFIFLMRWVLHMEDGKEALALCLAIEKLID